MFGGGWSDHNVTRAGEEANNLIGTIKIPGRETKRKARKPAQETSLSVQCIFR